jgi:hypothetical protein
MRRCRYRLCRQEFWPPKPNYYFCSWECHQAYYAEPGHDYRGYQRSHDQSYERGFWDGARARPPDLEIPIHIWKAAMVLVHPDKWQGVPAMQALAHEVTVWLNQHRPKS